MPRYRVTPGNRLSHSERVDVEVHNQRRGDRDIPAPLVVPGYKGRILEAGDELDLPAAEGKRLVAAGVLVPVRKRK